MLPGPLPPLVTRHVRSSSLAGRNLSMGSEPLAVRQRDLLVGAGPQLTDGLANPLAHGQMVPRDESPRDRHALTELRRLRGAGPEPGGTGHPRELAWRLVRSGRRSLPRINQPSRWRRSVSRCRTSGQPGRRRSRPPTCSSRRMGTRATSPVKCRRSLGVKQPPDRARQTGRAVLTTELAPGLACLRARVADTAHLRRAGRAAMLSGHTTDRRTRPAPAPRRRRRSQSRRARGFLMMQP